jgi:parallel beta-helix repeat protein
MGSPRRSPRAPGRNPTRAYVVLATIAIGAVLGVIIARISGDSPATSPAGSRPTKGGAGAESKRSDRVHGGEVRLEVGDDFQRIVLANPPGTRFVIASGVHRLQRVRPKNRMVFVGERGAVMSGAKVLRRFSREGNLWVVGGQTQQGFVHPDAGTQPGYERDNYPEDLFIDGRRLRHVSSKSEVGPGKWFFDYDANRIYIGDDPAGHLVETSATDYAFYGPGVKNVVIENVTVHHYANPAHTGALHAGDTRNWTIRYVDASHNHGIGVHTGPGTHLHHSRMAHNGQMGLRGESVDEKSGFDAPMVIEHNEIAHNRELGYSWGWEGGALKILKSTGTAFRNNWVHDNAGPGIWFDSSNRATTIASNLVEDNTHMGIFYEVSYGPTKISWNTVRRNGAGQPGADGAGILITSSRNVEVFGNAVDRNERGIALRMTDRGSGADGKFEVANVRVYNNDIRMLTGWTGLSEETGNDAYYTSKGNVFEDNTYRLDDKNARLFRWQRGPQTNTWKEWRAFGHDLPGALLTAETEPTIPQDGVPFSLVTYGAMALD